VSQSDNDNVDKRWVLTTFVDVLNHYRRSPELMTPFLLQSFLGLLLSWLGVRFAFDLGVEQVGMLAFAVFGVVSLVVQGWALCWFGDVPERKSRPSIALRRALRRWVSLLGVSFLAALSGALLIVVVSGLTSGWVLMLGTSLVATLINWLVLLAIAAVVLDQKRAGYGLNNAFLALGGQPKRVLAVFLSLFVYGAFNAYWGESALLLGGFEPSLRGWERWGVVMWFVVNALSSPILYLFLVAFYREHVNVVAQESPL